MPGHNSQCSPNKHANKLIQIKKQIMDFMEMAHSHPRHNLQPQLFVPLLLHEYFFGVVKEGNNQNTKQEFFSYF